LNDQQKYSVVVIIVKKLSIFHIFMLFLLSYFSACLPIGCVDLFLFSFEYFSIMYLNGQSIAEVNVYELELRCN